MPRTTSPHHRPVGPHVRCSVNTEHRTRLDRASERRGGTWEALDSGDVAEGPHSLGGYEGLHAADLQRCTWWQVKDSNLGSFRDGFTDGRSHVVDLGSGGGVGRFSHSSATRVEFGRAGRGAGSIAEHKSLPEWLGQGWPAGSSRSDA